MELAVDDFEHHLRVLDDQYEVVSLDDAISRWDETGSENLVVITFDDGYEDTFSQAHPMLVERGMPYLLYLATGMVESDSDPETLNWDQVETMFASGLVTVAAHTHSHPDLREMSEPMVEEQIEMSDQLFEKRLGQRPMHFAYPWGYWSEVADSAIRRRYETAALGGTYRSDRRDDPHLLSRFPVQLSDGSRWFEARLRGGLLGEEWLRRRLKGYSGP